MSMAVANSNILGQYENSQGTAKQSMTDKDTFLTLLITQLTHQDPLNPVEDTEFLSQLAQFNSVEQLQNLNSTVESMSGIITQSQVTSAVGLIGSAVQAKGDFVRFVSNVNDTGEDYYTILTADLPRAASEVYVNVYATDSDGNIGSLVYSTTAGARNAGEMDIEWPGHTNNGTTAPDGIYIVNVTAVDHNGNNMLVDTSSGGIVVGVKTETDGNHKLYLDDGRTVNFHDVQKITYVPATTTPDPEPEGGTSTPEGTTPEGTTPEETTPEGTTPEETTPEGTTPDETATGGTTPDDTTAGNTTPGE